MLGRNKIKYLASLRYKKFRVMHQQFLMEGDKIVKDLLLNPQVVINQVIATGSWIDINMPLLTKPATEVVEATESDMERITTLETPPPAIALLTMKPPQYNEHEVANSLSLALDNIQDPGNLGTIVRTADWFGIRNIFCSAGCADLYNPKVIQASMGAILNVNLHYSDLTAVFRQFSTIPGFTISGTFMDGLPVNSITPPKKGMIVFGNESRGIAPEYLTYINQRLTIPAGDLNRIHVESLNVASAVAAVCAIFQCNN